jgi:nitrate reductase NapE component
MERSRTISFEPSGEQSNSNRLFIFLAIALLGLICIGLVGLGGAVYLYQTNFAEQAALPTPTIIIPVETATNTSTPTLVPTETPLPTATGTKVVAVSGEEVSVEDQVPAEGSTQTPVEEPTTTPTEALALPTAEDQEVATATSTMVIEVPTSESESAPTEEIGATPTATTAPEMPGSGGVMPASGNFLIWIGIAVLAILLLGVWKQSRSSHLS